MKLFLDTNILLDVLMARKPYLEDSSLVWKLCETGKMDGYVSTLSFANLVYIMRRQLSPREIEKVLRELSLIFTFVGLLPEDLLEAASLEWNDFEDAIQYAGARRIGADYIISRNVRDFEGSKVPPIPPDQFIHRLLK